MRRFALIAATALLAVASTAQARDTRVEQSLRELVNSQAARDAGIDGSVRFYLAGEKVNVQQRLGEDVTNKKTNAANKSDEEACAGSPCRRCARCRTAPSRATPTRWWTS